MKCTLCNDIVFSRGMPFNPIITLNIIIANVINEVIIHSDTKTTFLVIVEIKLN